MNESKQILVTSINSYFYGFDISQCREVQKDISITTVPFSKTHIIGIANCRGEAVSVIDLAYLLNIDPPKSTPILLLLKKDNKSIAVAVESIWDVLDISTQDWKGMDFHREDRENELISHLVEIEWGTLKIIRSERLFS